MTLTKQELLELFNSSLNNAYDLFIASQQIAFHSEINKFPSLGLAELALEELGKSYTCLAYYSKADTTDEWKEFWKDWRSHDVKAHRAFLYEFFCTLRIEMEGNEELVFPTARGKFSKEKESSFYVDIDRGSRAIHKPQIEISDEECIRRVTSLMGLFNAVFSIQDWLNENHNENFRNAISDYAYIILTNEIYHEQVIDVLSYMVSGNEDYDKGLSAIKELFTPKL